MGVRARRDVCRPVCWGAVHAPKRQPVPVHETLWHAYPEPPFCVDHRGRRAGARVQTRQRKPDEPLHRQGCLRQRLAPAPGSDWSQERLPPAVTRAESALLLEPSEQWVLSLLSSHFKVERDLGCKGIVVSPPRPIAPPSFIPLDQAAPALEWEGALPRVLVTGNSPGDVLRPEVLHAHP